MKLSKQPSYSQKNATLNHTQTLKKKKKRQPDQQKPPKQTARFVEM